MNKQLRYKILMRQESGFELGKHPYICRPNAGVVKLVDLSTDRQAKFAVRVFFKD